MSNFVNGLRRTANEREVAKIASELKEQQSLTLLLFAVVRWLDDISSRYGLDAKNGGLLFILTEQWLDEGGVSPEEDFLSFLEREKPVEEA